jgi:hypothetical protein
VTAYSDLVLSDSPAWYWPLPVSGANAIPSIGVNGEWLSGGSAAGFQWGWSGPGGNGSYLGISGATLSGQTNVTVGPQFTMEYWTFGGGEQQGTAQASNAEFQISSGTPQSIFDGIGRSGTTWTTITHTGPLSTTGVSRGAELRWRHLVLATNATGYDFYVDGAVAHSFTTTLDTQSGVVFTIQRVIGFPCWFSEPAVYSAALTSTRIAAHYAAGSLAAPRYTQSLTSCN